MTRGYGLTIDDIKQSCPSEMDVYIEANEFELKVRDTEMHRMGIYVMDAVGVSLARAFSKNSKAEYMKEPLLETAEKNNKELSEEEKQRQRELFVANLQTMQTNFELEHPKSDG